MWSLLSPILSAPEHPLLVLGIVAWLAIVFAAWALCRAAAD